MAKPIQKFHHLQAHRVGGPVPVARPEKGAPENLNRLRSDLVGERLIGAPIRITRWGQTKKPYALPQPRIDANMASAITTERSAGELACPGGRAA